MILGVEGRIGYKHTDDFKAKQSIERTEIKKSEEEKLKSMRQGLIKDIKYIKELEYDGKAVKKHLEKASITFKKSINGQKDL